MINIVKKAIPLIIATPLFIVIGPVVGFSLMKAEHVGVGIAIPLSLVLLVFLILSTLYNSKLLMLMIFISLHLALVYIKELNYLSLSVWVYFVAFFAFKQLFKYNIKDYKKIIMTSFIFSLYVMQFSLIVSDMIFGLSYKSFFTNEFYAYNYLQYFSISISLGLAVLVNIVKNKFYIFNYFLVGLIGAVHSENTTGFILILSIILIHYLFFNKRIGKSLDSVFVPILIALPIIVPLIVVGYVGLYSIDQSQAELIMNGRGFIWSQYANLINFNNFFLGDVPSLAGAMNVASIHNLFFYYILTFTPFVGIVLYFLLVKSVVEIYDKKTRLYVLMTLMVAGINLELITHPFFSIQLAFVVALLNRNLGRSKYGMQQLLQKQRYEVAVLGLQGSK